MTKRVKAAQTVAMTRVEMDFGANSVPCCMKAPMVYQKALPVCVREREREKERERERERERKRERKRVRELKLTCKEPLHRKGAEFLIVFSAFKKV